MSVAFAKYDQGDAYHWREASRHVLYGWPYTRSRMAWVVRHCRGSKRVLEIGCGDGALLGRLAAAGHEVTGIDRDDRALGLAATMLSRRGLRAELHPDLRFVKHQCFDAIVLAEVIEHLDDAAGALAAAAKLLTSDGRLVLTTPVRLLERPLDRHHVHEFWPQELRALLERFFEDVQMSRLHPAWLVDLMCWGRGRVKPVAILANLVHLVTGVEVLDRLGSPLGVYWTQGALACRPRGERPL
ncbi:MAG TPA: class I SAM-dependent methyltransferase [Methylomirabilota bacterium]|jgi:SAM-dependent methyltransferase|nr:class I SAM-dependent methyltransferase [Methylomirabilota bacterium]